MTTNETPTLPAMAAEAVAKEDIAGKLTALAGIAPPSADGWTYLNDAARELIEKAASAFRTSPPKPDKGAVEALRERIADLEAALEPFAEAAGQIAPDVPDLKDTRGWTFQARDFRRAARLSSKGMAE